MQPRHCEARSAVAIQPHRWGAVGVVALRLWAGTGAPLRMADGLVFVPD